MTQKFRTADGGRIDRGQTLTFTFNGKTYQGFRGDTLASALLANGVRVVARSFKYHRPRGIFAAGTEDPNAVVQLETGAATIPNLQATEIPLYDGLTASSVNCWPNVRFDIGILNNAFARLLPAGFYYKTFMWPKALWMTYERVIRMAAGLGRAPTAPDPDTYDKMHAHCDVLVVGGGPTGLMAALAAGRSGARVIVCDLDTEMGGRLLAERDSVDGKPGADWAATVIAELESLPDVTVLRETTAFGYYDHNYLGLIETRPAGSATRQRLWKVRAKEVVLATGAIERPLVFRNNDRPGVMLAGSVRAYLNRWGVAAGERLVVFANNDDAYRTAIDAHDAGMAVAAVVDVRATPGTIAERARALGVEVLTAHAVVDVCGWDRVRSARVAPLNDTRDGLAGNARDISCDLIATSGGWNPAVHLSSHSGARAAFDADIQSFRPGPPVQAERSAGSADGTFDLAGCLDDGASAGTEAATRAGFDVPATPPPTSAPQDAVAPIEALWVAPSEETKGFGAKHFIDLHNDVTAADINLAAREGYRSIEHTKRYTTLGMGPDQGKTGNIPGMAALAQALGEPIHETGTTTFRPPFTPVTYGALAGRDIGPDFSDPKRKTPMHHWHESVGAKFEDVGQWKRPWYYPKPGETMDAALARECLAARNAVGILDATTLGKIDIQGPDAAEFLNRIYTNAWSKLDIGKCRYGLMLGEDGMVMDDGVTSRLGENHFLMTTTTGNAARVLGWLEEWLQTEWPDLKVYCNSVTEGWATMTICGPKARALLSEFTSDIDLDADAFPFMTWRQGFVAGIPARVFRISFTGESSYEINVPSSYGLALWTALMTAGEKYGITPYGTETMHILRAEKGYIIVGQETDGTVTPYDLGMDWIVSKKKPDFIGKRSLMRPDCLREGRKQLVGLLTENPQDVLPEGAQLVFHVERKAPMKMVGYVTSSYMSATLGRSIALALVEDGRAHMGESIAAPLLGEGRTIRAEIVAPVFYDPDGEKLNA